MYHIDDKGRIIIERDEGEEGWPTRDQMAYMNLKWLKSIGRLIDAEIEVGYELMRKAML